MPKGDKLELAMNLPVRGTLMYADYAQSEHGDQLRITGKFKQTTEDGELVDRGESHFYLPLGALQAFTGVGVISRPVDGEVDRFNNQKYHVKSQKQMVEIVRREVKGDNGKKKGQTIVKLLDQSGKVITPPTEGDAPSPAPTKKTTVPEATGDGATLKKTTDVAAARAEWSLIREATIVASSIAVDALKKGLGCEVQDIDQQAVVSLTATILIRAEHYGVPVAKGMSREERTDASPARARPPAPTPSPSPAPTRTPAPVGAAREPGTSDDEVDEFPL